MISGRADGFMVRSLETERRAIMRDQKQQGQSTAKEKKKGTTELGDDELKNVSGGKVSFQDINVTPKVDKASPKL
jgi:type VI protein secretion system component Hcp